MNLKNCLCIALFAMAILSSCNKDKEISVSKGKQIVEVKNLLELPDSIGVQVEDGILSFESEASLQKCIDYLNLIGNSSFDEFEELLGYTSFRTYCKEKSETYSVEDDLFGTLMNQDRQIIVADYLLTSNLEGQTTTIKPLNSPNLKSSGYLLEDKVELKWEEDLFEYLETGKSTVSSLKRSFCNNTDKKEDWVHLDDYDMFGNLVFGSRIQAKVCFQRSGWYNSIIIKFKLERSAKNPACYYLHYKTLNAKYQRRNRSTTSFSREKSRYAYDQGDEISNRPYSGTRRLAWADVPVQFDFIAKIYMASTSGWPSDEESPVLEAKSIVLTMKCT